MCKRSLQKSLKEIARLQREKLIEPIGDPFSPHKLRDYSVPLACAIRVVKLADATGGGAAKIRGHALTRACVRARG